MKRGIIPDIFRAADTRNTKETNKTSKTYQNFQRVSFATARIVQEEMANLHNYRVSINCNVSGDGNTEQRIL